MGMASGEGDIHFGTDVGKWGAKGAVIFLPAKGGKLYFTTPCVCTRTARIFVEKSNMGGNHGKNFRPPDPTSKSAPGCWPIHLSPVTQGGGGGGASRGGPL